VVFELLKGGSNTSKLLQAENDEGERALHLAVYSGNMLIVEQLLDRGACVNAQNSYGETCLFYAARRSYPALVRLLLQRGADADIKDRNDEVAMDHADDGHTQRAFAIWTGARGGQQQQQQQQQQQKQLQQQQEQQQQLSHQELLHIFSFFDAKQVGRGALVCGKWHRVSEAEVLWANLGIRRWECALQSSLGFDTLAASSVFSLARKSNSTLVSSSVSSSSSSSGGKK